MEKKINIAELLKGCPKGMELDCLMYDNVTLDGVSIKSDYPIRIIINNNVHTRLTKYGQNLCIEDAKCVIFPKGKTTWEGFQRPFKDGDILVGKSNQPFIFKKLNNSNGCFSYCGIDRRGSFLLASDDWTFANSLRFATEEEKQKLFDAIKENGYKWNPETKALEKLKVSKFDITTLKAFDKVLVRDTNEYCWHATFYSHYTGTYFYTISGLYAQCVPYEENKHLLGTKDDCDEYFKTWE